jgi:hypothetical protein
VPRVVPSEVVSAIDRLFGSSRNELDTGIIRFKNRDEVRTLLSLVNQVPDDLITVPFADYVEYLHCRSALTSALSGWDALNHGTMVGSVGGKDAIERIRRIFLGCSDENPPPHTEFTFIHDTQAHASVQEDIRAAWIDFRAGEWKGATVFAATAVEALLFWALKGRADLLQPERLNKWHLREFIDQAQKLSLITKATADQSYLATDARDLIHAGKMARTGLTCTKATALAALAALEAVIGDLR